MKDHEIALLVNKLRDTARVFHDSQQLRERIARIIVPLLKDPTQPKETEMSKLIKHFLFGKVPTTVAYDDDMASFKLLRKDANPTFTDMLKKVGFHESGDHLSLHLKLIPDYDGPQMLYKIAGKLGVPIEPQGKGPVEP